MRAIVIILLIALFIFAMQSEGFATADEKAAAVHTWFTKNPKASYAKYRDDLNRKSNIVEYDMMRELTARKPDFTVSDVKKII